MTCYAPRSKKESDKKREETAKRRRNTRAVFGGERISLIKRRGRIDIDVPSRILRNMKTLKN